MHDPVVVVFLRVFSLQCHLRSRNTLLSLNALNLEPNSMLKYVCRNAKYCCALDVKTFSSGAWNQNRTVVVGRTLKK